MNDLVSVVIAAYKNFEGLYDTLDSIYSQTYDNIEVIVTDDGSPNFNENVENIEKYFKEHEGGNVKKYIINHLEVNQGTVKNCNSGYKRASGKYIMVPSPEDVFTTNETVEHCVNYIKNSDYLIVFGKIRGVTPDGEFKYELESCESDINLLRSYTVEQTLNRLFARDFLPGIGWIADTSIFEKYGYHDEDIRLIEDYPYWMHLALNGVKFGYIDEVIIDYKLSGVSSSGEYSEMFMEDMFKIYNKYVFPNDKRYGAFQGLYNSLKRGGLNYYMARARKDKMTPGERRKAAIKYFPFQLYVKMGARKVEKKNKSIDR